jgi:hypothetical protein
MNKEKSITLRLPPEELDLIRAFPHRPAAKMAPPVPKLEPSLLPEPAATAASRPAPSRATLRRNWISRLVAVGGTLAALGVCRVSGGSLPETASVLILLAPVFAGAFLGGAVPGLLATLLATVAVCIPGLYGSSTFALDSVPGAVRCGALLLLGASVSALFEAMQRAG